MRAVLGIALGVWLLSVAIDLRPADYGTPEPALETVRFDAHAFRWVAWVALVLAPARLVQGAMALRRVPAARGFGKLLATVDLVNLAAFPLSTALGLYGWVVYRHPGTAEFLGCRRRLEPEPTA